MKVYKFRGLEQMDFVFEILFKKELFCAEYFRLNDPSEGAYEYKTHHGSEYDHSRMGDISRAKVTLRVCSLSKTIDNHLLWAHYASGFSGVAIEFEVDPTENEIVDINYRGLTYANIDNANSSSPEALAREALSSKYNAWKYEQEIRILTTKTLYRLEKPIKRLIVGHRMPSTLKEALRIVCEKLQIEILQTSIGEKGIGTVRLPRYVRVNHWSP